MSFCPNFSAHLIEKRVIVIYTKRWDLIADNAVHPIHLKQKSKKSRKKRIATAIYEYQVDHDGEWGVLSLNFESKTAEIVKLADWDTIKSNKYAKAAASYLLHCKNENLPKDIIIPFEN